VLRNLTTREYVREAALEQHREDFGLVDPIFLRAHWPDVRAIPFDSYKYGGDWAGHHFDITTLGEIQDDRRTSART
jgi:hypothetical protein